MASYNNLPRLFLLLALVFFPDLAFAQIPRVNDILNSDYNRIRKTGNRLFRSAKSDKAKEEQQLQLQSFYIDDQTAMLVDSEGQFLYLGNIGKLQNGNQFPNGKGLCRTVIIDPDTGESAFEYCLCPWKRGSRHGDGVIKLPDGTYRKARWKWDRLKSTAIEPPTTEEIESLDKMIDRLNRLLQAL